ncbi:uncharacterized protein LOC134536594 [Bacillus rossius redtenbacheri]|uniref:uncharacterized protein LOC134536594 n=1 Tax=Bacillus rossius redtenbacheri TaxID=93214 RepID=UPI002FDE12A3
MKVFSIVCILCISVNYCLTMPFTGTGWIQDLSKATLGRLLVDLKLPDVDPENMTMDELRQRARAHFNKSSESSSDGHIPGIPKIKESRCLEFIVKPVLDHLPVLKNCEPENIILFLCLVEEVLDLNILNSGSIFSLLLTHVPSELRALVIKAQCNNWAWEQVKQEMIFFNTNQKTRERLRDRFICRSQGEDESALAFVTDITKYVKVLGNPYSELELVEIIEDNLCTEIRTHCLVQKPSSIEELIEVVSKAECRMSMGKYKIKIENKPRKYLERARCETCGKTNHVTSNCYYRKRGGNPTDKTTVDRNRQDHKKGACFKCGDIGHWSNICPTMSKKPE